MAKLIPAYDEALRRFGKYSNEDLKKFKFIMMQVCGSGSGIEMIRLLSSRRLLGEDSLERQEIVDVLHDTMRLKNPRISASFKRMEQANILERTRKQRVNFQLKQKMLHSIINALVQLEPFLDEIELPKREYEQVIRD